MTNVEGVDYKKFIQSSKTNKTKISAKAKSKYEIFYHPKKVNDQNKNKLSEKKVRHTYVVQTKEIDLSKKKNMSLLEGCVATKLKIKDYIKWSGVYQWTGLNLEERKIKLIEVMSNLHSEECMIDDEYIYPRGVDYAQKVILFTHRRIQYLNYSSSEIKKEYEQMDLVWTLNWFKIFSDNEKFKFNFMDDSDFKGREIPLKNFLTLCQKHRKEFYKVRDAFGNLYGKIKGRERFLTYVECETILKKNWMKSYVRILSILIGEIGMETLQEEYGFIRYEKKIKNNTPNANEFISKPEMISLDWLNLNSQQLSSFKKYIYKNHPIQKELIYDSDTKSYYITKEAYEWFSDVYSSSKKTYERIQNDLCWYQKYFQKRFIYIENEQLDLKYANVKKVWKLTEIEYECYMALGKFKLEKEMLSAVEYENLFVELKLRHLVYEKNSREETERKKYVMKRRKTMYTQIQYLSFLGVYEGVVSNLKTINHYCEIYIETSYSDELEYLKIKLDLNWFARNDRIILMQLLKKGVSIQFEAIKNQITGDVELGSFTVRQVGCFDKVEKEDGDIRYKLNL